MTRNIAPHAAPRRPLVPRPPAITVIEPPPHEHGGTYRDAPPDTAELILMRRWRSPSTHLMLVFCILWDGFLALWYGGSAGAPLSVKLFPLLHVGFGVYMTYSVAAQLFNTTIITASRRVLSIRHTPLPWPGGAQLPIDRIETLYCEAQVRQDRDMSRACRLNAVMRDGTKRPLLSGLPDQAQALFIERRLEHHFGLTDVEVAGELSAERPLGWRGLP